MFTFIYSQSAGIIINEVSNGPSGSQEWVELLVIGDPLNPTDPVDLTGWILDDNNGDFEANSAGVGITTGHIIFTSAFSSVPPGSLIVIYNDQAGEQDPLLPSDDVTDSNGDNIYVLPANDASFNVCTTTPTIGDASYICSVPVVSAALIPNVWSRVGLRNGGDAIQIRQPNGTFYHGYSYGDVDTVFPTFPINGLPSFDIGAGGTGSTFGFECSDWEESGNFFRSDNSSSTVRSPGISNSSLNQIFIDKIKNGTLDYTNLSNSANCSSIPVPVIIITNRNTTFRVNN